MKNLIVVIGGAGFVGSNLIEHFILNTKKNFILNNYSTGSKNHIKNKRIKYVKETQLILLNYFLKKEKK